MERVTTPSFNNLLVIKQRGFVKHWRPVDILRREKCPARVVAFPRSSLQLKRNFSASHLTLTQPTDNIRNAN